MFDMKPAPSSFDVAPEAIAIAIGVAERREICGLLALLEAANALEMIKSLASSAQEKLGWIPPRTEERVAAESARLFAGLQSTQILRHRLWAEIAQALDMPEQPPLSLRKIRSAAAAMGLRAAEVLKPSVVARRRAAESPSESLVGGIGDRLLHAAQRLRKRSAEEIGFPDIVAAELEALLNGVRPLDLESSFDPEAAAAIRKGQVAMAAAAATGGGWAAFAAAVGSAGFAPYVVAAKLSAFIPFVSGPALVSFLAVMINPATVVAGGAALGYWAVKGQASSTRRTAAARVAVLLALRGLQDQEAGLSALVSVFRNLHRASAQDLAYLGKDQIKRLVQRSRRLEERIGRDLPPVSPPAPAPWSAPIFKTRDRASTDAGLVGALTAADMLHHAVAIDPAVLAAADFSRGLDLGDPLELAAHIAAFSTRGAVVGLRGYTAEQVVMARLIEQGHSVELAPGSATAGLDLIVDGYPMQVKCGESLSLLWEHFSRYPEIPVIADVELARMAVAAEAPWSAMVTTIDGFELETIQNLVDRSLDATQALGDANLPVYAMIIGGVRAANRVWTGEIPVEDLPACMVLDLSLRGGLAAAGQVGGAFLGLLAIGPAGALILGPVVGVAALMGTTKAHGLVDRAIRDEWHARVTKSAEELRLALIASCGRRIDSLAKRENLTRRYGARLTEKIRLWEESRMLDDTIAA